MVTVRNDITGEEMQVDVSPAIAWFAVEKAARKWGRLKKDDITSFEQDGKLLFVRGVSKGAMVTVRMTIVEEAK